MYFYLFIWLHWALVAACRIFGCGMWDLIPWPGVEPGPPALGMQSLSHWTTREALDFFFFPYEGFFSDHDIWSCFLGFLQTCRWPLLYHLAVALGTYHNLRLLYFACWLIVWFLYSLRMVGSTSALKIHCCVSSVSSHGARQGGDALWIIIVRMNRSHF